MSKVLLVCENCEISFEREKSKHEFRMKKDSSTFCKKTFCSISCVRDFKSKQYKTANCEHCGKQITVALWRIKQGFGRFCSVSCSTSYTHSKREHTSTNYYIRKQALKMFPKCYFCTYSIFSVLEVHHIDGNHNNNPKDGSNWMVLCPTHHKEIHQGIIAIPNAKATVLRKEIYAGVFQEDKQT